MLCQKQQTNGSLYVVPGWGGRKPSRITAAILMTAMHCRGKSVMELCSAVAVLANMETVLLSCILLQCSKNPNRMPSAVKLSDFIVLLRQRAPHVQHMGPSGTGCALSLM